MTQEKTGNDIRVRNNAVSFAEQITVAERYVAAVNERNGWFDQKRQFGVDIALLHSEVSEMLEAYRISDWDGVAEEMADVFIRLLDTSYRYHIDLADAFEKKMLKNATRPYRHGNKKV